MSKPMESKESEIDSNYISSEIVEKPKIKKEDLVKDINLIFSYARCHVANAHPQDENVMIGIIEIKKVLIDILNKDA